MTKCCAFCENCEENICLAHSKGYEAYVRFPLAQGKDCNDFIYSPEMEEGWKREQEEQAKLWEEREAARRVEREAREKAEAEAKAKAEAERAIAEAAKNAEIAAELEEFKQWVREAKAGHNDLRPDGGYLKIGKYAFKMTPEVWAAV